jgi:Cu-processing system permease protein
MLKIIGFTVKDFLRSWWNILYTIFFLGTAFSFLFLNNDLNDGIVSIMNIVILLCPLIGSIFGYMYFYNSQEFTNLLLAQPLKRRDIFLGQYIGLAVSLSMSLIIGFGLPFVIYGLTISAEIWNFVVLLFSGVALTFIFTAIAFLVAIYATNKLKGFGIVILIWLFLALIYDAIFLMVLFRFADYPLEKPSIIISMFNPIDLARVLILLKLDVSALMGYTGALFSKFFHQAIGMIVSSIVLLLWIIIPTLWMIQKAKRRDF